MGIRGTGRAQLFPRPGAAPCSPWPPCRRALRRDAGAAFPLRSCRSPIKGRGHHGPPTAAPRGGHSERPSGIHSLPSPLPSSGAGGGRAAGAGRERPRGRVRGAPGGTSRAPRGWRRPGDGTRHAGNAPRPHPRPRPGPARPGACGCSCSGVSSQPGCRGPLRSVMRAQAAGNGTSPALVPGGPSQPVPGCSCSRVSALRERSIGGGWAPPARCLTVECVSRKG